MSRSLRQRNHAALVCSHPVGTTCLHAGCISSIEIRRCRVVPTATKEIYTPKIFTHQCIVYSKNWGSSQRKARQRRAFRDDAPQNSALTGYETSLVFIRSCSALNPSCFTGIHVRDHLRLRSQHSFDCLLRKDTVRDRVKCSFPVNLHPPGGCRNSGMQISEPK